MDSCNSGKNARIKHCAVYAGSFDPVTNGHLDIILRAAPLFDKLIVAVANNPNKRQLFTTDERMSFIKHVTKEITNVEVDCFDTLLVEYIREKNVPIIIRGLRAVADFENEFQMALINKKLLPEVETVFLATNTEFSFVSSSAIKEVASFNGDVSMFVDPLVVGELYRKLGKST
jgi:pantetheine-phosphate adenylyltransferase